MSLRAAAAYNAISTTQLPHRRMEETSFGCAPPEPIQFPVFNATSNTTAYIEIPQEIHNVEITFNYEIKHWSNVKWDSNADGSQNEESSDSDGGWFSKLFGGRMLSNESNVEWTNSSGTILEDLEIVMATSIWDTMLNDPNMTFTNNNGTKECAGLVVSEEEETVTNDDVNTDFQTDNSATNLLGLTIYPADVVNPDGEFMYYVHLVYVFSHHMFLTVCVSRHQDASTHLTNAQPSLVKCLQHTAAPTNSASPATLSIC
jgi:hypothetical protein